MCGELKVNQKTIRISDSVYDYKIRNCNTFFLQ